MSLTENLDAMAAIQHIPSTTGTPSSTRWGTLVKNAAHWRVFETVFEVYFSLRGAEYADEQAQALADLEELMGEQEAQETSGAPAAWATR